VNRNNFLLGVKPSRCRAGQVWYNPSVFADPRRITLAQKDDDLMWKLSDGTYIAEDLILQYFVLEQP
jgi:hypothetical protein